MTPGTRLGPDFEAAFRQLEETRELVAAVRQLADYLVEDMTRQLEIVDARRARARALSLPVAPGAAIPPAAPGPDRLSRPEARPLLAVGMGRTLRGVE